MTIGADLCVMVQFVLQSAAEDGEGEEAEEMVRKLKEICDSFKSTGKRSRAKRLKASENESRYGLFKFEMC